MKKMYYDWSDNIYLLHIETKNYKDKELFIDIIRHHCDNSITTEKKNISLLSNRFTLMRFTPKEVKATLIYNDITVSLFELEDRAYFPTKALHIL